MTELRFALSRNGVHGFMDMAWDDYRMPAWFWISAQRDDSGCWLINTRAPQLMVARRVLKVKRDDLIAAVPTCGAVKCANPAHICVTMRPR